MVWHAAGEDREVEVRRLGLRIGTNNAARLHRLDPESAGLIGADPAETVEIGSPAVRRVRIAALGIRLPDLDKAVDHGSARPVDHLSQ